MQGRNIFVEIPALDLLSMDFNIENVYWPYNLIGKNANFCFNTKPINDTYYTLTDTTPKPTLKELTIAEIEKKLGYKIKVVGE
jgi:hypothetical protein